MEVKTVKAWLSEPSSDTQITHTRRLWLYAISVMVMLFLVAPSLIVVPLSFSGSAHLEFPPQTWSFRWYHAYMSSVEWREATTISVTVGLLTVLLATPLGTAAAYGLHMSGIRWSRFVYAMLMLPMVVPIILLGIGVFFLFARLGLLNTILGLTLAHTMLAIPFVLIIVTARLQTFDMNQERVARSLGASRLTAFLTVTLPQIKFSIVSAGLIAFVTSFDEVVMALFISGGARSTLTRRMFSSLRDQVDPTIAAISTFLIILSILVVVLSQIAALRSGTDGQHPE